MIHKLKITPSNRNAKSAKKTTNKQTNQIVFIRETPIKITLRYRFAPMKMAVLQKTQNTRTTGEDVEELEPSCTPRPGGRENRAAPAEAEQPSLRHRVTTRSRDAAPRQRSKGRDK